MIEIASPATPQISSLLPLRRRRSPNEAPGASCEHGRRENMRRIGTNTGNHTYDFLAEFARVLRSGSRGYR